MLKFISYIFAGYLCIMSANAFKLKMRQIRIYSDIYVEFETEKTYYSNAPHASSFHTTLSVSDFADGRGPLYLIYNLALKDDGSHSTRKMGQEFLIANYVRSDDLEKHFRLPKEYRYKVYFGRRIKFGIPKISLTGKVKVVTGKIKRFKVKLSRLKEHLQGLEKDNIKISFMFDAKTKNYFLKTDIKDKKYFHVCLDDSTSRKPEKDISIFTETNGYAINPELFKSDGVYLVIIYAEDIKSQVIDVNFNVPLKWKTITFPKNKKMKLVPVGTEDKTP